jgi:hypothetical protein
MDEQTTLALPLAVGQAVLDYLGRQPYAEVWQLVAALQSLAVVPQDEASE